MREYIKKFHRELKPFTPTRLTIKPKPPKYWRPTMSEMKRMPWLIELLPDLAREYGLVE